MSGYFASCVFTVLFKVVTIILIIIHVTAIVAAVLLHNCCSYCYKEFDEYIMAVFGYLEKAEGQYIKSYTCLFL